MLATDGHPVHPRLNPRLQHKSGKGGYVLKSGCEEYAYSEDNMSLHAHLNNHGGIGKAEMCNHVGEMQGFAGPNI